MTARGNCVSCGTALDGTGFCWNCAGDGKPEVRPDPVAVRIPPSAEPLPQGMAKRAKACMVAAVMDKALAVALCEAMERDYPGLGWRACAEELGRLKRKPGPMARVIARMYPEEEGPSRPPSAP